MTRIEQMKASYLPHIKAAVDRHNQMLVSKLKILLFCIGDPEMYTDRVVMLQSMGDDVGIEVEFLSLPDTLTQDQMEDHIWMMQLNRYNGVVIWDYTLKYDIDELRQLIMLPKDVEGVRAESAFEDCRVEAIVGLLPEIDWRGKPVIVDGANEDLNHAVVNALIDFGANVIAFPNVASDDEMFFSYMLDMADLFIKLDGSYNNNAIMVGAEFVPTYDFLTAHSIALLQNMAHMFIEGDDEEENEDETL